MPLERIGWVLPYLAPAFIVVIEWALLSPVPALADHFQFWAAGHIVATGGSPYDRGAWEAMAASGPLPEGVAVNTVIGNLRITRDVWLYPPETGFVLVPFGALPLAVGVPAWHLFVLAATLASVVLVARVFGLSGSRLALALTIAVVSEPVVITIRDGHPIGLVLAGLALVYLGLREHRMSLLAAGVALVSLKPHIAIAFALGALAYMAWRDRRALAVSAGTLAVVTVPAEIAQPFPLDVVVRASAQRAGLDVSTTGALARDLGGGPALAFAIGLAAVVAAVIALRAAPAAARGAVGFASLGALSLVPVPYAHDYDLLLVLPALFTSLVLARGSRAELAVAGLFGLVLGPVTWLLFFWWPLLGEGGRVYQGGPLGALPLISLVVLAVAALRARRRAAERARLSPG